MFSWMLSFPGINATRQVTLFITDLQTDSSLSSQASLTVIKVGFHLTRSDNGKIRHFLEQGGRKKEKTLPLPILHLSRVAEQQ